MSGTVETPLNLLSSRSLSTGSSRFFIGLTSFSFLPYQLRSYCIFDPCCFTISLSSSPASLLIHYSLLDILAIKLRLLTSPVVVGDNIKIPHHTERAPLSLPLRLANKLSKLGKFHSGDALVVPLTPPDNK
jgi:hypothetical protein